MADDVVRGFKLRDDLMGHKPSCREYYIPAGDGTATFVGDLVKISGEVDADGVPAVIQAAASDACVGVVLGFNRVKGLSDTNFNLYARHRPASVKMYCLVCDDPNALYEGQEDSDGGNIAVSDGQKNVNFVVGSGSTSFGLSGMEIDSSSVNTTATLTLKLVSGAMYPGASLPEANGKWIVKINNHQFGSHTGTAGVA